MPTSPRTRHVRFYDILRQICRCPTGGQRRPPLQNVLRFRRTSCNFVIASCRVDVGIDPYKRITDSPGCIRVCRRVPPGGQRRPPLQVHAVSHWRGQICDILPRGRGRTPPLRLDRQPNTNPRPVRAGVILFLHHANIVAPELVQLVAAEQSRRCLRAVAAL